jgi:hypothetical protein
VCVSVMGVLCNTYMYMYVCVYVRVCAYIYMCVWVCVSESGGMLECQYSCASVCISSEGVGEGEGECEGVGEGVGDGECVCNGCTRIVHLLWLIKSYRTYTGRLLPHTEQIPYKKTEFVFEFTIFTRIEQDMYDVARTYGTRRHVQYMRMHISIHVK